jgi:hypothetical protein
MSELPGLNDVQKGVIEELNSIDAELWKITEDVLEGSQAIANGDSGVTMQSESLKDVDIFDDAGNITSGGLFALNQINTILGTHAKAVTNTGQAEANNRKTIGDMTSR